MCPLLSTGLSLVKEEEGVAAVREFRRGQTLGSLSVRELIGEGRS